MQRQDFLELYHKPGPERRIQYDEFVRTVVTSLVFKSFAKRYTLKLHIPQQVGNLRISLWGNVCIKMPDDLRLAKTADRKTL